MNMKKGMTGGLILAIATLFMAVAPAGVNNGESYYTRANIWYELPEKIYSTNYHVGAILPIGSRVQIIKAGRDSVQFCDEKGVAYVIHYIAKHSTGTMDSFLSSTFSSENILESEEYKQLSDTEKENISKGIVAAGMSKPAVLMAYGYPPSHRTQSTTLNTWVYWQNRFKTIAVNFGADGKATSVTP
jgi:hypothetical protein